MFSLLAKVLSARYGGKSNEQRVEDPVRSSLQTTKAHGLMPVEFFMQLSYEPRCMLLATTISTLISFPQTDIATLTKPKHKPIRQPYPPSLPVSHPERGFEAAALDVDLPEAFRAPHHEPAGNLVHLLSAFMGDPPKHDSEAQNSPTAHVI